MFMLVCSKAGVDGHCGLRGAHRLLLVGPDTARDASPVLHRLVHHSALPCYSGAIVSTLTPHPCDIVVSSGCTSWTALR